MMFVKAILYTVIRDDANIMLFANMYMHVTFILQNQDWAREM